MTKEQVGIVKVKNTASGNPIIFDAKDIAFLQQYNMHTHMGHLIKKKACIKRTPISEEGTNFSIKAKWPIPIPNMSRLWRFHCWLVCHNVIFISII